VQDLEQWPYPQRQIVPMTETVHERFSVEIFRGCTRGCRFCQAGMITRPVRERRPETVQRLVEEGVADTGFEEVGLLSLSSADHSAIGPIARSLGDTYEGTVTSLSLPSTRVDAFNVTLSNELTRNGRRSGLTFAPEAGSERMRAVINKMVSEEDLLRTAEVAFSQGWRHIKLYFMVGLPTETDEDVLAIADLGIAVYRIARAHGKANKVTLSVGGFVPKPHTPFQWAAQDTPEEIRRKLGADPPADPHPRRHPLRTNDPEEGVIEGLLARGDRRVADAVERAWRLGARFDGWHEVRRSTCGAARWTRPASRSPGTRSASATRTRRSRGTTSTAGSRRAGCGRTGRRRGPPCSSTTAAGPPATTAACAPASTSSTTPATSPVRCCPSSRPPPPTSAARRTPPCRRAPSATRPPRPQHPEVAR
jgi:radical SAM superfamily enzyme YgiQ (UPF0313 family)